MNLKLVFPSEKHESLWYDIIREMGSTEEEMVPYSLSFRQQDFHVFLQKTKDFYQGINLDGFVPASTYFLMDEKEDMIYGAINIRHSLNEYLLLRGGHIGYGVRPSQRRKGFATKMLSLALEKCIEIGLKKILVTCDQENIGSAMTITYNGGVLENEVTEEDGNVIQRYWIEIV